MSNTEIFAEEKFKLRSFISIEHGTSTITISIYHGDRFLSKLLWPDEAMKIAKDLMRRAEEIKKEDGSK